MPTLRISSPTRIRGRWLTVEVDGLTLAEFKTWRAAVRKRIRASDVFDRHGCNGTLALSMLMERHPHIAGFDALVLSRCLNRRARVEEV